MHNPFFQSHFRNMPWAAATRSSQSTVEVLPVTIFLLQLFFLAVNNIFGGHLSCASKWAATFCPNKCLCSLLLPILLNGCAAPKHLEMICQPFTTFPSNTNLFPSHLPVHEDRIKLHLTELSPKTWTRRRLHRRTFSRSSGFHFFCLTLFVECFSADVILQQSNAAKLRHIHYVTQVNTQRRCSVCCSDHVLRVTGLLHLNYLFKKLAWQYLTLT